MTEQQFKRIQPARKRLADEAYEQLLDAIASGRIAHNERLVQERLAAQLNISRTPVREALIRLEQDGILVTSPRGGFLIRTISDREVRELYQARAAIESQAVRILASEGNNAKNRKLRRVIVHEEDLAEETVEAYFNANRAIHRSFVELTENRYLLEMFDNIWNRGTSYQLFAAIEHVDLSNSLGHHLRLVDAIESGDLTRALDDMIAHITAGFELQLQALGASAADA